MTRSPAARSFEYWLHSAKHAWRPSLLASVLGPVLYLAALGVFDSPWALLTLPAAVLTGMAFAAPIAAFAITQDRDLAFAALNRFAIVPMFMFSGTFFPIAELPGTLEPIAYITPLWHGVDLTRELSLGTAGI